MNILAQNKEHLKELVEQQINKHGKECDLNYIDVSKIKDMSQLFYRSDFNGDISEWVVPNVTDMSYMFNSSQFNQDISRWGISNVVDMRFMFYGSQFNQDLSDWKPLSLLEKIISYLIGQILRLSSCHQLSIVMNYRKS